MFQRGYKRKKIGFFKIKLNQNSIIKPRNKYDKTA